MRDQLVQYVSLMFAGAKNCEDIKQEILQNTLDRYDDLVAEGKAPEAAYQLAISGIGDINEILGVQLNSMQYVQPVQKKTEENLFRKCIRAIAVGLYIICILPLIILSELGLDTLGLCITVIIVAIATVIMLLTSQPSSEEKSVERPESPLEKSIGSLIWAIGLSFYFIISFSTGAWYITWLIFPLIGAVQGLVRAIVDLREAI